VINGVFLTWLAFFTLNCNLIEELPYRIDHIPGTNSPTWMDAEPNDTIADAVVSETTTPANGAITSAKDVDVFKYTGNAGDVFTASLTPPDGVTYGVRVYDANGTVINQSDTGSVTFTLQATAPFYVEVYSVNGSFDDSAPYTLRLSLTPLGTVATPTFNPVSGTYTTQQSVAITSATSGASIYYTNDNTTPDCFGKGIGYSGPVTVNMSTTLKAIACLNGYTASAVATANYNYNGTLGSPILSLGSGTWRVDKTVSITDADPALAPVNICYTTDGSIPSCDATATCTTGTLYAGSITISALSGNTTVNNVKAIACKVDYTTSNVTSATYTIDKTPPVQVPNLGATSGGASSVNLSWTNGSDDITPAGSLVYEICMSTTSGACATTFTVAKTTTAGALTASFTGLNPLTTYYFMARAIDGIGNTGSSGVEVQATTDPAGTAVSPTFSVATGTYGANKNVTLATTTTNPATICYTTNGGNPACDATATCTTGTAYSTAVPISTAAGTTTVTTLKALTCKTGYTDSPVASRTYTIDKTAPAQLTGAVAAATGTSQILLSWNASTDDKSLQSNLIYEVCVSATTGGCNTFTVGLTTSAGVTSTTKTALTAATTYYFRIRAKDEMGNAGLASAEVSATTSAAGVTNSPVVGVSSGTYGADQSVSLTSSTTGATICYSTDGVTTPTCDSGTSTCPSGTKYTGAFNVSAAAGTTSTTNLQALACAPTFTASGIVTASYVIDKTAPTQVTGVTATAGGTNQFNLNWTASSDDQTAAGSLVYEVCYSTVNGGCNTFSVNNTVIGTVGLPLTISSLTANTTYYVKVRATDAVGNISAASTQVTVTTNALGTANTPTFTVSAGTYATDLSVGINSTTPTPSAICFTNNGTNPGCNGSTGVCTAGTTFTANQAITAAAGTTNTKTLKALSCKAGYVPSAISSATYNVDKLAPTQVTGVAATVVSTSQINLSWSAATDTITPSGSIVYQICMSTTSTGCNTFSNTYVTLGGVTSKSITGLSPLTTYYFKVRAKDLVTNIGTPSTQVSATTQALGTVATITSTPAAGSYYGYQLVSLSTATTGATLRYTTNGSTPTCASTIYSTPLSILKTTVIKTIGCKTGWNNSAIGTHTITVLSPKVVAFAWVHSATGTNYAPYTTWSYNAAGGAITINRTAVGTYNVVFAGANLTNSVMLLNAYNSNAYCYQSAYPTATTVYVKCTNTAGALADTQFTLAVINQVQTGTGVIAGYVYNSSPYATLNVPYTPSVSYSYNPTGTISMTRTGTGQYTVVFNGQPTTGSHAPIVTGYFTSGTYCSVTTWSSSTVYVKCYNATGVLTDSYFTLAFFKGASGIISNAITAGYALASNYLTASYTPSATTLYTHANSTVTAAHSSTGNYTMEFLGLQQGPGVPLISAYGAPLGESMCQLAGNWGGGTMATARCYLRGSTTLKDAWYSVVWFKTE